MINLPRNLVYTDRTALTDFTDENGLYREIAFVLEGILQFQCSYYAPASSELVEKNILCIFNNAYYMAILATHDAEAPLFFQNYDKYGSGFHSMQVALVLLALQEEKTEQTKMILAIMERVLNPLLLQLILKCREEKKTYRMDFSPCPPPVSSLKVDWEKATGNFNPEKVVKIISLWKTKDDRRKVLHCIWRTAGILQDGASYSEACAYLRMLDQALEDGDGSLVNVARYYANEISRLNKELNLLKEEKASLQAKVNMPANTAWVRTVVDYAKGMSNRNEALPFLHMLEHIFRGTGTPELFAVVDEITEHFDRKEEKEKSFGIGQTDTFINRAENIYLVPDQETLKRKQLN